jgi:hypothetical protein
MSHQFDLFGDEPEKRARRHDPDTSKDTARRIKIRSQCLQVLRGYRNGQALIDHDAYRLAGFPPGRTSHQRCSDLRDFGWIARTGDRGPTPSGHSGYKCRITEAGMRVLLNTGPRVE